AAGAHPARSHDARDDRLGAAREPPGQRRVLDDPGGGRVSGPEPRRARRGPGGAEAGRGEHAAEYRAGVLRLAERALFISRQREKTPKETRCLDPALGALALLPRLRPPQEILLRPPLLLVPVLRRRVERQVRIAEVR